ncbi:MAG: histidinol-phosphate transaminase [Nitrospirae bacterium]|nr:histidinol-phosphate transaminase [Nitrospirota bacterium]
MTIEIGEHIRSIEPYKPGKPLEELERELGIKDAIKLASNENPLGPSKKALAVLKKGLTGLHRYPEGSGRRLREAIAQKHKLKPEQVILGNGSDEIMDLAAKTFLAPGDEAILGDITFAIYHISVTAHHGISVRVPLRDGRYDLEAMATRLTPMTRLIFICNPNNPTGTMIRRRELDRLLNRLPPNALVIMDEAYAEYADDPEFPNTIDDVKRGAPVLVLRTFSKMYGLAGLRIGYGLSTPAVVAAMNRVRLPFNTNSLAQAAALAALSDESHTARSLRLNREGRRYLSNAFADLGLTFLPSQANFIYVDIGRDGAAVYERLLRKGVIVRHMEGPRLRISIGRPAENRRFVKALGQVLKTGSR